jgi:uncharacterized protein VirK/YbjX
MKMLLKNIGQLWIISAAVCEGRGLMIIMRRIRFVVRALAVYSSVAPIINASRTSSLGRLVEDRPETIGAVIWPYQCSDWSARIRLGRICDHYSVVDSIGGLIDFPVHASISLLNLSEIREGLSVVVDQPTWFMREGQLTINLFHGETRLFSLAFSLIHEQDDIAAFVGAIQGRDIEGALDQYRELTKASHGMRPRDLLIEIFRMLCASLGVRHIFAVADEYRHHRSPYFGDAPAKRSLLNYNDIWEDRGGVRIDPKYYRLGIAGVQRDISAISAKKRGMYRRRYDMLNGLKEKMNEVISPLKAPSRSPTGRELEGN